MIQPTSRPTWNILRFSWNLFRFLFSFLRCFQWIQNNLKFHWTLKCVFLRFENDTDMIEKSSIIYRQGVLGNNNDPCVFYKDVIVVLTITSNPIPFVTLILALVWDFITGIIIPSSISLPTRLFNSFCLIPSSWPSHVLQLGCNLTEWALNIFRHADEQTPLLTHTPQPIPLDYLSSTLITTLLWYGDWWCLSSQQWWWLDMVSLSKD
jgi:hypothetical protein